MVSGGVPRSPAILLTGAPASHILRPRTRSQVTWRRAGRCLVVQAGRTHSRFPQSWWKVALAPTTIRLAWSGYQSTHMAVTAA